MNVLILKILGFQQQDTFHHHQSSREKSPALVCNLPVDPTELNNIDLMFLSSRYSVTIDRTLFHHHQSSREQKRALVCHQPVKTIKLYNVE